MNIKRIFLIGAVSSLLFLLLYACIHDELSVDSDRTFPKELEFGKNSELTIATAKSWYGAHKNPISRMATTSHNKWGFLVTPSWNHAKEWKKGHYEVVEISLRSNMNVFFMDEETNSKIEQMKKEERKKVMNVGRCVILKDIISGKILTFNMVIIGNYNYLMKDKNRLSDNNYLFREPNFDGKILYFNTEGEFVNGWTYRNGKIVKRLSPVPEWDEKLIDEASKAESRTNLECHIEYEYYSHYVCPNSRSTFMNDWANGYNEGEFGASDDNWDVDAGEIGGGVEITCYLETRRIPHEVCNVVDDNTNEGEYEDNESPGHNDNSNNNSSGNSNDKKEDEKEDEEIKLSLSQQNYVTVGQTYQMRVTINSDTLKMKKVVYQMNRATRGINWITVYEDNTPQKNKSVYNRLAWTPGQWEIKVIVDFGKVVKESKSWVVIDEEYPELTRFEENPTLLNHLSTTLWNMAVEFAKNNASTHAVREYGCFIYMKQSIFKRCTKITQPC